VKRDLLALVCFGLSLGCCAAPTQAPAKVSMPAVLIQTQLPNDAKLEQRRAEERLSFQTGDPWSPRINMNADVSIVYGLGPKLPNLVQTWHEHGYKIELMTGVAWGAYQDYFDGKYDGTTYWDQVQTDVDGKRILHGANPMVPFVSPGEDFGRYLSVGVKRALDMGVEAVYLEEPGFWARSGWEGNFKHEWKAYYGEDWRAPNSSPDAQYRASKLKYFLHRRTLTQVCDFVNGYGKEHGHTIPCYVASHSLLNYANWRIVSPESSLINVAAAGYIAQIWTGTARIPNMYEGRKRERTFETAFLEYGAMQNLVRASRRRVWYLNDPIMDNPYHTWDDYRANWQSTVTASLMQPDVWRFEIMPWPRRVFTGKHPATELAADKYREEQNSTTSSASGFSEEQPGVPLVGIPKNYEAELQSVISALGDMKQPNVKWEVAGTRGVGVLVSDTMMFERADPQPSDEYLGSFYGLALPLLKRGIPVEPVQIESAAAARFLDRYRLLLLTYEGQKPPKPEFHAALVKWVRAGGALLVVDNDDDPYNTVHEWWNSAPMAYKTPREHLFKLLGIPRDGGGLFRVGKGVVVSERLSPAALTYKSDGADELRAAARRAAAGVNLKWSEANALALRRGPYVIAAGLDESVPNAKPVALQGRFIDLFDANLPVKTRVKLGPGVREMLYDVNAGATQAAPKVVVAACRVREEKYVDRKLSFWAEGIEDTNAVVRIATRQKPVKVLVGGKELAVDAWGLENGTVLLRFANSVDPVQVVIVF
jgi:hypothetical protein